MKLLKGLEIINNIGYLSRWQSTRRVGPSPLASSIEIFITMMKAMSVFFKVGEIQDYVYPREWHDPLIFSNFSLKLSIVWLMVVFFEDIIVEGLHLNVLRTFKLFTWLLSIIEISLLRWYLHTRKYGKCVFRSSKISSTNQWTCKF